MRWAIPAPQFLTFSTSKPCGVGAQSELLSSSVWRKQLSLWASRSRRQLRVEKYILLRAIELQNLGFACSAPLEPATWLWDHLRRILSLGAPPARWESSVLKSIAQDSLFRPLLLSPTRAGVLRAAAEPSVALGARRAPCSACWRSRWQGAALNGSDFYSITQNEDLIINWWSFMVTVVYLPVRTIRVTHTIGVCKN